MGKTLDSIPRSKTQEVEVKNAVVTQNKPWRARPTTKMPVRPLGRGGAAVGVLVLLGGLLAACGASTAPVKHSTKPLIGFDVARTSVPFFLAMENGVRSGARTYGARVIIDNANNSATTQVDQIRTMLNDGVKALIINAVDAASVAPITLLAKRDHVLVVSPGTGIPGGAVYATVESNPVTLGEQQAAELVKALTAKYGSPTGDVVYAEGIMTLNAGRGELKGFTSVLKKYPSIHLIDTIQGQFAEAPAYAAFRAVLAAHPAVSGPGAIVAAVGANDASAEGMAQAIKAAGRFYPPSSPHHILVLGTDGGPTGLAYMKSGELDVIIGQHPTEMGSLSVKFALAALKHIPPPPNGHYYTSTVVITPANLNTVQIWGKTLS